MNTPWAESEEEENDEEDVADVFGIKGYFRLTQGMDR